MNFRFSGEKIGGVLSKNYDISNILSYDYNTIEDSQEKLNNKYMVAQSKTGTFGLDRLNYDVFHLILKNIENVIQFKPPVDDSNDDVIL